MAQNSIKSKLKRDTYTESLWQKVDRDISSQELFSPSSDPYDVLIIGAGITGITAALLLQKEGKKCVLVDGNSIGFGTTGGTTAHLNTFFDLTYPEIESKFGAEAAKQVARAGREALNTIRSFIDDYQIDCDFEEKDGYLFSQNEDETKQLSEILKSSIAAKVLVDEVEKNGVPVPFERSLRFRNQAQFHPTKYIIALVKEFQKLGGILKENTFIQETTLEDGIHTAKAGEFTLKAKHIIYATHIPPGVNLFSFKCAPYRSYVLGIKLADNAYPDCLSYDMKDPYHYFRTHEIDGEPYLILGGEDHKTGHADPSAAFQNLEEYATQHFNVNSIPFKWSAQYYSPADGLPYIGEMPAGDEKIFVATGYNGNGMQFGTLAAKIISASILGQKHEHAELFSASRIKPIAGFTEFVKENADVAYHFVADRFSAQEIESLKAIHPGEGMLVDFKDQKMAVYKSETGKVTALNPVCSHAKCIVNFNKEEKSWDCPCHGGRFDLDGKVLTGPPRHNLQQISLE